MFEVCLAGCRPLLVQGPSGCLDGGARQSAESGSAPQRQCLTQQPDRAFEVRCGAVGTGLEIVEPQRIQLGRGDVDAVAGDGGGDRRFAAERDRGAESGHDVADLFVGGGRWSGIPYELGQGADRHRAVGVEEQSGQETLFARAAGDYRPSVGADL